MRPLVLAVLPLALAAACGPGSTTARAASDGPLVAHLGRADEDAAGLTAIAERFAERNPGYALYWADRLDGVAAVDRALAVFVQSGEGVAELAGGAEGDPTLSDLAVGDLVLLRPGQRLASDDALAGVVFAIPDPLPAELPTFVRPDWDPGITDVPGGCATEEGAYRRILVTWLESNGAYVWRAINAHRVRIMDSFTHYHPLRDGFDEFYLVQMVQPGGRLLTSRDVEAIEDPGSLTPERAAALLTSTPLEVGDLVYLPRGTVHRGLGGVLAQVITVPGFRPGAEIGVDHHLLAANERLGLTGAAALPFNAEASLAPVVR